MRLSTPISECWPGLGTKAPIDRSPSDASPSTGKGIGSSEKKVPPPALSSTAPWIGAIGVPAAMNTGSIGIRMSTAGAERRSRRFPVRASRPGAPFDSPTRRPPQDFRLGLVGRLASQSLRHST